MRFTLDRQGPFDVMALHSALKAINLPGFSGVSVDETNVHLEFIFDYELHESQLDAIAKIWDAYNQGPDWQDVRRQRVPLLLEADWRIARAEDSGEDTKDLRAYRQQLRDVTSQGSPDSVAWPVKPW